MRKKKILIKILGAVLSVIALLVVFISVTASKNVKSMNSFVDAALNQLKANYTVTPIDVGDYKEMKIYGLMKFHVEQYHIEELGNLSVMRVNMGFMQMGTFVITPLDKNMPLLSADYMYIMSNRKAYLEFYDVVKEKDDPYQELLGALKSALSEYSHLEDVEATPAWYAHLLTVTSYKGGSPKEDADLERMLVDCLKVYCNHAKQLPLLSEEAALEKVAVTVEYTDGLISNGGISTDVFKDALGAEETKKFFDQVFFGTAIK